MATTSVSSSASPPNVDLEQGTAANDPLLNTTVQTLAWKGITVTVKDRETKLPKIIVDNVSGLVEAGEILTLMGPSGSGKTTLLNYLASRPTGAASATGTVLVNGHTPPLATLRTLSRFVEQDDALTGALTVRETMLFASRLSSSSTGGGVKQRRTARIESLIDAFGLREQADTLVGTPLRKGISGGQKRRLGVASQLVTGPKVLFLDEPTSGLDSVAGWEVVRFLRGVARRERLIVVMSIHQPSTATFNLFDKLLLMSQGKTHYFGGIEGVAAHYEALGYPMPVHVNPAEFVLEMVSTDFAVDRESALQRLGQMQLAWAESERAREVNAAVAATESTEKGSPGLAELETTERKRSLPSLVLTLLHRSFVKSYRDVVVYGIRLAMYTGLAIMMGTVWLRLDAKQESIIPFINATMPSAASRSRNTQKTEVKKAWTFGWKLASQYEIAEKTREKMTRMMAHVSDQHGEPEGKEPGGRGGSIQRYGMPMRKLDTIMAVAP